jgi:hypothetical protein
MPSLQFWLFKEMLVKHCSFVMPHWLPEFVVHAKLPMDKRKENSAII